MSPDLDQLRQRWQAAHQAALPQLHLDVQALRTRLQQRSERAFAWHRRWLGAGLLGQLALCALLGVFLVNHGHDAVYRLLVLPLLALAGAQALVSVRQWQVLRRLDLCAPVLEVRATLDRLRGRQLQMTRWILLSSVLLWLPLVLVVFKGLFGVDLLDHLHPSVVYVNLGLGVGVLLGGDVLLRVLARRWQGQAWWRRWLVEMAGISWQQAEQSYDAQIALDRELADGDPTQVLARHQQRDTLPQQLRAPLRRLRRRLLVATLCWATLLILIGMYNASVGGVVSLIVPGVLLNGWVVVQMVAAIVHRQRLGHLDYSDPALSAHMAALGATQLRIAAVGVALLPLTLLLLIQVLGYILAGHNLVLSQPVPLQCALLVIAAGASLWLLRRTQQHRLAVPARCLLFGAAGLSEALRALDHHR